jgi:hypothetical protein
MNRKVTRVIAIIIVVVMALSFLASMILPYIF